MKPKRSSWSRISRPPAPLGVQGLPRKAHRLRNHARPPPQFVLKSYMSFVSDMVECRLSDTDMESIMLEERLLSRIQEKKARLDALRPLPAAAVRRLNEQLTIEWIYNSNAIEGSTLSLRETQLILEQGITIGGKSLREHFEVINHQEAIKLVESLAGQQEPLTAFYVRQLHALVLTKIDDENAGQYRNVPVRIVGAAHEPPSSWELPAQMNDWSAWIQAQEGAMETVALSAMAHHKLVAIHPFIDGNGRTARLIMNLVLMRDGYPPAIIARVNRRQYYRTLAQADGGNSAPLVNFVGRAVERSLTLYLEASTPQTAPPMPADEWLPLREAAELVPYSQDYLSLLARMGKLEAIKRGRIWHTTRRALEVYMASVAEQ